MTIKFTHHAADRYIERVRPSLRDREEAMRDLERLARFGTITNERPRWVEGFAPAWLVVGNLVFPLHHRKAPGGVLLDEWCGMTCLVRPEQEPPRKRTDRIAPPDSHLWRRRFRRRRAEQQAA